jgi:nucleolin
MGKSSKVTTPAAAAKVNADAKAVSKSKKEGKKVASAPVEAAPVKVCLGATELESCRRSADIQEKKSKKSKKEPTPPPSSSSESESDSEESSDESSDDDEEAKPAAAAAVRILVL